MSRGFMKDDTKISTVELGWSDAVVMVCTKCGKQFNDSKLIESPERIKSDLKARTKSEMGRQVRVITTSCLNICPVDKIAVAVASNTGGPVFKAYEVDPNISGDELFKTIFKK
jgi:predicted metal-binding protein